MDMNKVCQDHKIFFLIKNLTTNIVFDSFNKKFSL